MPIVDAWDRLREMLPLDVAQELLSRVVEIGAKGESCTPRLGFGFAQGQLVEVSWEPDRRIPVKRRRP